MKKKIFTKLGVLIILASTFPVIAFAQAACSQHEKTKLGGLIDWFTCIIGGSVVRLIFAIALVTFIWGVVQYVITDNEEKRAKGKQLMVWGLIGLFVMVTVWGLVNILAVTFGVETSKAPTLPVLGQ
ncbi:MAG: hypothetical protein KBD52_02605 [Candidatus Pacebacteria bacterium]|nr:hypothetical protein [Candidatus Paceibacterota bacterium]